MRPFFIALPLLFHLANTWAQESGDMDFEYPKHHVTVSFMDMVDPFAPAFMLGYEQFFGKEFSILAEGGPVSSFDGNYLNQNRLEGYKLRGELRYNFDASNEKARYYLGLQGMYRHTIKPDLNSTFCRYDCAYYQELDYYFEKNAMAGHLSLGFSSAVTEHLFLEIGGFGGFRIIEGRYGDVPDDAFLVSDELNFTLDQEGANFIPSIGFTFKMGFGW